MSTARTLRIVETTTDLANAAAEYFVDIVREAVAARGRCVVALSGGSTPILMHRQLASDNAAGLIDWARVLIFWGDERFVPHEHPDSNFRMAHESLLDLVPIPPQNIYGVETDDDPENAASRYEEAIRDELGPDTPFDLIILGLGEDGHTASLFPAEPVPVDDDSLVKVVFESPKPPPTRITFTFALINRARRVVFLVSGSSKHRALASVLESTSVPALPASAVKPVAGSVAWIVDRAAYECQP